MEALRDEEEGFMGVAYCNSMLPLLVSGLVGNAGVVEAVPLKLFPIFFKSAFTDGYGSGGNLSEVFGRSVFGIDSLVGLGAAFTAALPSASPNKA